MIADRQHVSSIKRLALTRIDDRTTAVPSSIVPTSCSIARPRSNMRPDLMVSSIMIVPDCVQLGNSLKRRCIAQRLGIVQHSHEQQVTVRTVRVVRRIRLTLELFELLRLCQSLLPLRCFCPSLLSICLRHSLIGLSFPLLLNLLDVGFRIPVWREPLDDPHQPWRILYRNWSHHLCKSIT